MAARIPISVCIFFLITLVASPSFAEETREPNSSEPDSSSFASANQKAIELKNETGPRFRISRAGCAFSLAVGSAETMLAFGIGNLIIHSGVGGDGPAAMLMVTGLLGLQGLYITADSALGVLTRFMFTHWLMGGDGPSAMPSTELLVQDVLKLFRHFFEQKQNASAAGFVRPIDTLMKNLFRLTKEVRRLPITSNPESQRLDGLWLELVALANRNELKASTIVNEESQSLAKPSLRVIRSIRENAAGLGYNVEAVRSEASGWGEPK